MFLLLTWDTEAAFAPRVFVSVEAAETWIAANPLEVLDNYVLLPAPGLKVLRLVDPV